MLEHKQTTNPLQLHLLERRRTRAHQKLLSPPPASTKDAALPEPNATVQLATVCISDAASADAPTSPAAIRRQPAVSLSPTLPRLFPRRDPLPPGGLSPRRRETHHLGRSPLVETHQQYKKRRTVGGPGYIVSPGIRSLRPCWVNRGFRASPTGFWFFSSQLGRAAGFQYIGVRGRAAGSLPATLVFKPSLHCFAARPLFASSPRTS